jgi:hypothetical protein
MLELAHQHLRGFELRTALGTTTDVRFERRGAESGLAVQKLVDLVGQ